MPSFEEREKSEEAKFALEREGAFKIAARRNKRLGLWLAERLHLDPAEWEALAAEVMAAGIKAPQDEALVRELMGLIEARGGGVEAGELRREMSSLLIRVRAELGLTG